MHDMPIRLRIVILFTVLVIIILGLLCGGIYYFSHTARLKTIKTRLENRAITTARLLAQKEIFDQELVKRIDSLTTIALKNKTVQAYDYQNRKLYNYSDVFGDTLSITEEDLDDARVNGTIYFTVDDKISKKIRTLIYYLKLSLYCLSATLFFSSKEGKVI